MSARRSFGLFPPLLMAALAAFSTAIGWAAITLRETPVSERQVMYRPIQVQEDGYVSSKACKACHPSQYNTWYRSFHRTMTQLAIPATVRADFNEVQIVEVYGRPMNLARRGDQFWAEFDDPDWKGQGDHAPRIERQVVMITGSHHQQVYWYRTEQDRVLGQLPGMYLISERQWIPRVSGFLVPPVEQPGSETGRWNGVCINCHATHGKQGFDTPFGSQPIETQVVDTTVAEFGIACEACHGPSEQHVGLNLSPLRRYGLHLSDRRDPTIVQPALLDPNLSSQVCGQCHGVWEHYDLPSERQANASGLPYRPGDELQRTRFVVQPTRNIDSPTMKKILAADSEYLEHSFWSDGMVRVSGREYNGLIESPCFKDAIEDRRTLSCFSCHTMHKPPDDPRSVDEWANHQVGAGMNSNDACLQCHPKFRTDVTTHTNHGLDSTGSDCYNCHMPYTSYGLLRALRSHQINSPTVTASLQTGRPNACNLCHLDKTLAWTSGYLEKWYGTQEVALTEDEQTIAASLLWLLRGDAGQRALVAWNMGWPPAQQASGTSWMGLYLAQLLADPYDAVRRISYRSLRTLPGFAEFKYNPFAPSHARLAEATRAADAWWDTTRAVDRRTDAELLFDAEGSPNADMVTRLGRQRDDRPMVLRE